MQEGEVWAPRGRAERVRVPEGRRSSPLGDDRRRFGITELDFQSKLVAGSVLEDMVVLRCFLARAAGGGFAGLKFHVADHQFRDRWSRQLRRGFNGGIRGGRGVWLR